MWHSFHGKSWNVGMTNEISATVIMKNWNAPGMGDHSLVNQTVFRADRADKVGGGRERKTVWFTRLGRSKVGLT